MAKTVNLLAMLVFTAIGLSFMFVEIAWLQRFVLYLGHPSLATTAGRLTAPMWSSTW